jgi:hypothetical protein
MGVAWEPSYIVTGKLEVLDQEGIEYLAKRSCDPSFLSYLFRTEAGPVDHTGEPFGEWDPSGLDYSLMQNACTPEEVFLRLHDRRQYEANRTKARIDPIVATAQDWSDPDCLKHADGVCKKYKEKPRPPKGYKDIGPGYVTHP